MPILDAVVGTALDAARGLVGKFLPASMSDAERTQAELAMAQAIDARDRALLESQATIMVAELQQDDRYTKRFRPSVGYALTVLVLFNFGIRPLFGMDPVPLPDEVWWCYTGLLSVYFVGRTWEKGRPAGGNGAAGSRVDGLVRRITGG